MAAAWRGSAEPGWKRAGGTLRQGRWTPEVVQARAVISLQPGEVCRHPLKRNAESGGETASRNPQSTYREVKKKRSRMGTILIVILVLALIGALPTWPYSRGWGYYPSGGVGLIVLILVILLLLGRL
jgi:hypothetical protein